MGKRLNPDKYEVLRITRKRNPVIFPYTLNNIQLNSTQEAKYLGVTINQDLSWTKHINNFTSKANNSLRFIKRDVNIPNKKIKETAYKTYDRPRVEYCSIVWHPWQKYLMYKIEHVQISAARYILNDYGYTSSVLKMINDLNWQTFAASKHQCCNLLVQNPKQHCQHLTQTRNLN
jgi:hypothetical protein